MDAGEENLTILLNAYAQIPFVCSLLLGFAVQTNLCSCDYNYNVITDFVQILLAISVICAFFGLSISSVILYQANKLLGSIGNAAASSYIKQTSSIRNYMRDSTYFGFTSFVFQAGLCSVCKADTAVRVINSLVYIFGLALIAYFFCAKMLI